MNRSQLIQEIVDFETPHESVMDEILLEDESQLRFRLWRLQNGWEEFDCRERFVETTTLRLLTKDQLHFLYEVERNAATLDLFKPIAY